MMGQRRGKFWQVCGEEEAQDVKGYHRDTSPRENIDVSEEKGTELAERGNLNALGIWERDVLGCVHGKKGQLTSNWEE